MDQLNVICWLWGQKYSPLDVDRLMRAIRKHLRREHHFHLFADLPYHFADPAITVHQIEDRDLIGRSCFCRLRMFDPDWQRRHGLSGQIFSADLDLVITGLLDDLFVTQSTFKILKGVNAVNPNPFNCSVMLLRAGEHAEVWNDFSVEKANRAPYHEFPDDQGWIWHKMPNADVWQAGPESGIYGFQKPGWPLGLAGTALPQDTRIVAFIGRRKPGMYTSLPWVKKYWAAP